MKKGEVWIVDFPVGKGHEQKGQRPAVILGCANGLSVAVPITSNLALAKFSHTFTLEPTRDNGLAVPSVVLVFQIVALDNESFQKQIGWIPNSQREAIDQLIKDLMKIA
ncbi:MAG: type II toxin-antitoxin system PemK/MazF family toxin [Candidatus Micrarchaeota archaeon]